MPGAGAPEDQGDARERWGEAYRRDKGVWEDFTGRVEQLVADLLERNGIEVVQLSSRTKTVDSFLGKLGRKGSKYDNPLEDVTDLAGVRVITYYPEDVDRVVECVRQEFEIDPEHSRGTIAASDPDRFGYQSAQYVARISEDRKKLAEWARFDTRCVEIQVRTALQHAWSAIDHKLNYKSEREVPRHLKRRLSRLSALLELADEEFTSLRDATEDLDREYVREIQKGHLDLDVDAASLTAYVETRAIGSLWTEIALKAGFGEPRGGGDIEDRDKRGLLLALQRSGIRTISELDRILGEAAASWGPSLLAELNVRSQAHGFRGTIYAEPYDVLTFIVLHAARADVVVTGEIGYHDSIRAALAELVGREA